MYSAKLHRYQYSENLPYQKTEKPELVVKQKVVRKRKPNVRLFIFSLILALVVLPFSFRSLYDKIIVNNVRNSAISMKDMNLINGSDSYITDNIFNGEHQLVKDGNSIMQPLELNQEMYSLKRILQSQIDAHPRLTPTIFVWEYSTGRFVDLRGEMPIATASIIKIPVLYELFRQVDKGIIRLNEKMTLYPYYVTDGSGYLQYKPANTTKLTIEELASLMIRTSDNSATNMLLARIGGMNQLNRSAKYWGVPGTQMKNWLPDLEGTNKTTSKDMATMLYNIDNPSLLSLSSRTKMISIMSKVKNIHLIKEGLPPNVQFFHKTGDIGEMLGDAGIVQMPNGKRYIIVVMVKRPWNSYEAKDFIINTSRTVYNYMSSI